MVLDHIKASTGSPLHPVYRILGQDISVDLPNQTLILSLVGAAFLGSYVLSLFKLFLDLTIRSGTDVRAFKTRNGSTWALVTGATSGIGLEFAKQLAAKGYNIIVFGRRQDALEEVAGDIEKNHKVQTRFVTVDFASPSSRAEKLAELEQTIAALDIGVLINNVGASHEMPVSFEDTSVEEMENIIQTNILGTLQLTRVVLPRLTAHSSNRKSKSKSLILNIGSMSGRIPSALLATYSCTKGGLQTWNRALAMEVQKQGVVVQMVLPAFVVSNMSKIRRSSVFVPTPAAFVRSTLSSIGRPGGAQGRAFEMTPYPTHAIADYVVGLFGGLSEWIGMKVVLDMHVGIRKRALRKKEKMGKAQ